MCKINIASELSPLGQYNKDKTPAINPSRYQRSVETEPNPFLSKLVQPLRCTIYVTG